MLKCKLLYEDSFLLLLFFIGKKMAMKDTWMQFNQKRTCWHLNNDCHNKIRKEKTANTLKIFLLEKSFQYVVAIQDSQIETKCQHNWTSKQSPAIFAVVKYEMLFDYMAQQFELVPFNTTEERSHKQKALTLSIIINLHQLYKSCRKL